jgi:hypothetical protein
MYSLRDRALRPSLFALLGLLALGACQDGDDPLAVPVEETTLAEAALDGVADQVELQQESLFADAERTRQRDRDRGHDRPALDRVGLVVAFSGAAVHLAQDILAREGADDRQRALLAQAVEQQRAAVAALEAGDPGRAVRMAQAACWTALKAWVAPGGVTREEAEKVQLHAHELVTAAAEAVGDDEGVRGQILSWAVTFYVHGAEQLELGQIRGVGALWKAAVLSWYLVG